MSMESSPISVVCVDVNLPDATAANFWTSLVFFSACRHQHLPIRLMVLTHRPKRTHHPFYFCPERDDGAFLPSAAPMQRIPISIVLSSTSNITLTCSWAFTAAVTPSTIARTRQQETRRCPGSLQWAQMSFVHLAFVHRVAVTSVGD